MDRIDISLIPDEVKTLVTVLKGQIFLLGKDWDGLLEPEKKELAQSAVKTVTELNDMVRGEPDGPTVLANDMVRGKADSPTLRVVG